MRLDTYTLSGSVTTGTTGAEVLGTVRGLSKYDWFTVDASLSGVPPGTLDVYLQRQVARSEQVSGGVWADWAHFPQLAAGASRAYYTAPSQSVDSITRVGRGTDASPGTPALAANTTIGGHPGDALRLVVKCGSATLTGTSISVYVTAWESNK